MKQLFLALAASILLMTACDSNKTIRVADFTATYPSTLEVIHSEDGFPNDAALFFQGENGQVGMNTVVYYADDELEYLDDLYDGLSGFIYNKMMELFNKVDEGMVFPNLDIDDVSDIEWTDDDMCGSFLFSGTRGEEESPWIGGITIYLNNGALVTSLAVGDTPEEIDELLNIATNFVFDQHEGSYQPDEERLIGGEEEE